MGPPPHLRGCTEEEEGEQRMMGLSTSMLSPQLGRDPPLWCQKGPGPQRPYWFSAFIHQHRLGTALEGRSRPWSTGWHLGCNEMRWLCGLVFIKDGLGDLGGFVFFFPAYLHTRVTR